MTASSPIPQISIELRAYAMFTNGDGYDDIAAKLLGKATDETRQSVRKLIEQGRSKSLSAH